MLDTAITGGAGPQIGGEAWAMMAAGSRQQGAVGIVWAGLMGGGIAALVCAAGIPVKVYDVDKGRLAQLGGRVKAIVEELEEYGLAGPGATAKLRDCLETISGYSGLSDCVAVIEAVFEDARIKKADTR